MVRSTISRLGDQSPDYAISVSVANAVLSKLVNSTIADDGGTTTVLVSLGAMEAYYNIPLTFFSSMHSPTVTEGTGCLLSAYCCTTPTGSARYYIIEPNSTTPLYHVFVADTPVLNWRLPIQFSSLTSKWTMYIDQDTLFDTLPSASDAGSTRELISKRKFSKNFLKSVLATSSVLSTELAFAVQSMLLTTGSSSTVLKVQNGEYVAVDPNWVVPPFVIPSSAMSDAAVAMPGMSQNSFSTYMQGKCSLSDALSLVQSASSPNDIFQPFWAYQALTSSQWIASIDKSAITPQDAPQNRLYVGVLNTLVSATDVLLNSSSYSLLAIQAQPTVAYASAYILTSNNSVIASSQSYAKETLNFYVDLKNEGDFAGYVKLLPWRCCYSTVDSDNALNSTSTPSCSSWIISTTVGASIDSQQTKRLNFQVSSVPNIPTIPYGYSGYCSFNMSTSRTNFISTIDIGFSIPAKSSSSSAPASSAINSNLSLDRTLVIDNGALTSCSTPFETVSSFPFCRPLCTLDQTLSASGSCNPVDCASKYLGTRDEYNSTQGLCKMNAFNLATPSSSPSPIASPTSSPDASPALNPITGPSLEPVPAGGERISSAFILQPDGTYTLDCGDHGTFVPSISNCRCDEGWVTDPDQYITTAEYCNMVKPKSTAKKVSVSQSFDGNDLLFATLGLMATSLLTLEVLIVYLYHRYTHVPMAPDTGLLPSDALNGHLVRQTDSTAGDGAKQPL